MDSNTIHKPMQVILNIALGMGHYSHNMIYSSLLRAKRAGDIDLQDLTYATEEIDNYLLSLGWVFLDSALKFNGYPHTEADCIRVLRDWDNRPKLTVNAKQMLKKD